MENGVEITFARATSRLNTRRVSGRAHTDTLEVERLVKPQDLDVISLNVIVSMPSSLMLLC